MLDAGSRRWPPALLTACRAARSRRLAFDGHRAARRRPCRPSRTTDSCIDAQQHQIHRLVTLQASLTCIEGHEPRRIGLVTIDAGFGSRLGDSRRAGEALAGGLRGVLVGAPHTNRRGPAWRGAGSATSSPAVANAPAWIEQIGASEIVSAAVISTAVFDDGRTVLLQSRHPDGEAMAVGVLIDRNLGGLRRQSASRRPVDQATDCAIGVAARRSPGVGRLLLSRRLFSPQRSTALGFRCCT
jgi:hypothetical protein